MASLGYFKPLGSDLPLGTEDQEPDTLAQVVVNLSKYKVKLGDH